MDAAGGDNWSLLHDGKYPLGYPEQYRTDRHREARGRISLCFHTSTTAVSDAISSRRVIIIVSFFLTLVSLLFFFARESSAVIRHSLLGEVSVSVGGTSRTKPRLVESLVEKCLDRGVYRSWESIDTSELQQCLINSRLFSKVSVRLNKPEILLQIKERWTLIPIPYFYTSNGDRTAGIFVFESNLLGYGKTIGIGGALSTQGNTFSLIYMDPSLLFTDRTLKLFAFRSSLDQKAYDGKTVVDGFRKVETGLMLSPGYKLTPTWEMNLSIGYSDRTFRQVDTFAVPGNLESWSVGAGLSYRDADYKLFFNDGLSARTEAFYQLSRSDGNTKTFFVTGKVEWDVALFRKHAVQVGLSGSYQSDTTAGDVRTFGQTNGYRGIRPNGLWSGKIISASIDYQVPVLQWNHGAVTVAPFLDGGIYESFIKGTGDSYIAYGVGAYYFMNYLNVPGIGITAGINDSFMGPFISLSLGMRFR